MKIQLGILVVLVLANLCSRGQAPENISTTFAGSSATIKYDLIGHSKRQTFTVELYSSFNNFTAPLKKVTGDVGLVKEGKEKKIIWQRDEMGNAKGTPSFRVKVTPIPLSLAFISPSAGEIRRGKKTIVEWDGGTITTEKTLELYRGTEKIAVLGTFKNVWQYTWKIPTHLEKGDGYFLKLSGGNEKAMTETFTIKSRIPLWLKLSPVVIAAAVIPFLGGNSSSRSATDTALPGAPNPN